MADESLIKLLRIIKTQVEKDPNFDAKHPRDAQGRFIAVDVHAEAAHENEDPNYDPYADEDIWGPKDDGLKKSSRQLSEIAQEIFDQTHGQIRGHGQLVSTKFPSNAQAHNLFASYKVGPHNPIASTLKYMIHRVENLESYRTPKGAAKADADFISGRKRAMTLARMPEEKHQAQPSIHELHAIVTKSPHLIDSLIQHRNALHEKLKGKTKVIDGEHHVALTRGLGIGSRAKDPMLASYADTHENTLGGRVKRFHNHWVPLKNVWYSYDHGPREATSHRWPSQDEFLVSPHDLKTAMSTDVKKLVPRKPKLGAAPAKTAAPITGELKASMGTSLVKLMKSFGYEFLQKSGQYIKFDPWILERNGGKRLESGERAKAARQIKGRGKISPQDMKTLIENRDLDLWDALMQRADLTKDNLTSMAMHPRGFDVGYADHHAKKKMNEVNRLMYEKLRAHNNEGDISDKIMAEGGDKAIRRLLTNAPGQVDGQHLFKLFTERPNIEPETAEQAMKHTSFDHSHMTEIINHPNPEVIRHGLAKMGRTIDPQVLERALTHASPIVRAAAFGGDRGYHMETRADVTDAQIIRGLNDPDEKVRTSAARRATGPLMIQHVLDHKLNSPDGAGLVTEIIKAGKSEITADHLRKIVNFGVTHAPDILHDYHLSHREDVPEDAIRQIMSMSDEHANPGRERQSIKIKWMSHKGVTSDVIQTALNHTADPNVLAAIANKGAATTEHLRAAWQKMPKDIDSPSYDDPYRNFAYNDNTPSDILHDLATNLATYGKNSLKLIAKHPNLDPADIEHFANSEAPETRMFAAQNPNASTEQISRGISDKDKDVRGLWMKHPKFGAEHLAVAMKDRSPTNRGRLAAHPAMTPEMLMNLLKKDKSEKVRLAALANPNSGPEHAEQAALHDPDENIRMKGLVHPRASVMLVDHALETSPSVSLAKLLINRGDLTSPQVEKLWNTVEQAKAAMPTNNAINAMPRTERSIKYRERSDISDLSLRYITHPQSTPAMHEKFRATAELTDISAVLGNGPEGTGGLSPEQLKAMWDREKSASFGGFTDSAIAAYIKVPGSVQAGILKELAESPKSNMRKYAAMSPHLPADIQMKLADDHDDEVHEGLAENPRITTQAMDKLISNPTITDRTAAKIANNHATTPDNLEKLMGHESHQVRAAVVSNPNASEAIVERGANDRDISVKKAAGKILAFIRPNAFNKSLDGGHEVDVHPATEKLKHLKGKVAELGGTVNKNALPNKGAGLPGQIFTGKGEITTDSIDNYLKTLPHSKFNVSYGSWNSSQRHDSTKPQKVLQLNMTDDHIRQLKEQNLFPTFKKMHESSHYSGHPVREHSLGWARIDDSQPGHWHIDEVQSDFGQGTIRQIESLEGEDPSQARQVEERFGMPMDAITDSLKKMIKIFSGPFKNVNHAIQAAVHQTARQNDITSTSVDKVEDQAVQSGMKNADGSRPWRPDGGRPLPGHMINTYKQIPEEMGYEEKPKKDVMPDSVSNETHVQHRKLTKSELARLAMLRDRLRGQLAKSRHPAAPGTNATGTMPHPAKPADKKHVRADTQTHQDFRYELGKSDAGQFQVHLGLTPSKESTGKYAQWHLTKEQLGHVLKNWGSVQWEHRSGSRQSSEGKFHSTAITRNKLSTPIAGYLSKHKPNGRVLYHGCGRDDIGAKALGAERHDPYHPDKAVQAMPKGKFDEVHSHYTLNVVDKNVGHKILSHIHSLMSDNGKAVISVRRDLTPSKRG